MRFGVALAVVASTACNSGDTPATPDAGTTGVDPGDEPDAATPDADPVDSTPPALVEIVPSPGTAVFLHAPIRLVFDEPLAATAMTTAMVRVGGAPIAAQVAFEPPSTLAIVLAPTARGVGALDLRLDLAVEDLAGNKLSSALDESWPVPAWHSVPIDRGLATAPPALATRERGSVVAAWVAGAPGSRRAVVAELAGTAWRDLDVPLGSGDVTAVTTALDTNGAPLVGWIEGGVAHVARWDAHAWTELPSPGPGNYVALATPPGGSPIAAVFGATVAVRELAGATWLPLGADIAPPAPIAGEPALAAPSARRAVVGWVDSTQQLRVYRLDAAWTSLAPIAVGPGSRMSLAARGQSVAIAWDQLAGSFGVLAAIATGNATAWTRLGGALDVDVAGDARSPAIELDASGAPIVAWTELVETAYRGALARWSGSAWTIAGGVTWLGSPTTAPNGTRLALDPSGAAIVATAAAGDVHVARLNGPRTPAAGIASRASLAGCTFDAGAPPALLSQTGCFQLARPNAPIAHRGLVPFDVVSELWSDGAKKRRWLGVPAGRAMTLGGNGAWIAPAGTLVVKEFALELAPGDPATRRPIETRVLVNDAQLGWQGFSYRWNASGTDAALIADTQLVVTWQLADGSQHAHFYPSRGQCRTCHNASVGPLRGLRPEQLARWNDYDGVIADQPSTLAQLGIAPATTPPAFTAPHDPSASWERRTRGYMAVNCSHCHNPQNVSVMDLRFATPLAATLICDRIVPGSPGQSRVVQLVTQRPGMPALGSLAVDPFARDLFSNWISGMTSCP